MKKYSEVPYIISSKDLDYLSDMFNWLYGAYKNNYDAIVNVSDKNIAKALKNVNQNLYDFMNQIISIMEEKIDEN